MGDLNPGSVERLLLDLLGEGTSGRLVNQVRQALTVAVGYHFKQLRQPSPLAGVEKVHEESKERGILLPNEISKMIATDADLRVKATVLLGLFCGLRSSVDKR